jgi:hypothetical protein
MLGAPMKKAALGRLCFCVSQEPAQRGKLLTPIKYSSTAFAA